MDENTPRPVKRPASDSFTPPGDTSKKFVGDPDNKHSNMAAIGQPIPTLLTSQGNTTSFSDFQYHPDTPSWFKPAWAFLGTYINELNNTVQYLNGEVGGLSQRCGGLDKKVNDLTTDNANLRHQVCMLEGRYQLLSQRLSKLENYTRRDNLVFEGVKELEDENSPEKTEEAVRKVIKEKMKIEDEIDIARAHRLGEKKTSQQGSPNHGQSDSKPRPLIVKFEKSKDRQKVWKHKRELKDTNISVGENFSRDVEEIRKMYYPIVKKARGIEQYKNSVYIRFDKLVVNQVEYTHNDLDQLPPPLRPSNVFTRTKNGVMGFYGKGSFLSNFYRCNFSENGISYNCVEQYYCYHKAKAAGNPALAQRVLLSEYPSDMKSLTNNLRGLNTQTWGEQGPEILLRGLRLKFSTSNRLYHMLKNTKDLTLAECNPHDTFYGTGVSMHDDSVFLNPKAKGTNVMGELLMQLRHEMSNA